MHRFLAFLFVVLLSFPFRIKYQLSIFNSVSIFDVALLGFGMLLLLFVIQRRGRLNVGNKTVFFLLAVPLGTGLLSMAWSEDLTKTVYYLVVLIECVVAYLVVVNLFHSLEGAAIMRYMAVMVFLTLGISVLSFYRVPGVGPFIAPPQDTIIASYYTRLSSPFLGLSDNLATVLAFFLLVFAAWAAVYNKWRYFLLAVITLAGIVLTASVGVLVAIALTAPIFVFWRIIKIKHLVLCILIVGALSAVGFIAAYHFSEHFQANYTYTLSMERVFSHGEQRLDRFAIAAERIYMSPLLGHGLGVTFPTESTTKFPIHCSYLEQMVWFGIPFGVANILALVALPVAFIRHGKKRGAVYKISLGVALALICQLLLFWVEASFEGTFLKVLFYVSVGFGVVLVNALAMNQQQLMGANHDPFFKTKP